MFERMLEARLASGHTGFSSTSVSVAVAGHLTLAGCLAAAAFLVVESIDDPEPVCIPPVNVVFEPDTAPPRHPPGGGASAAPRGGGSPRSEARRDLAPPPPSQRQQQPVLAPEAERDAILDELSRTDVARADDDLGPGGPDGPGGARTGSDPHGVGEGDGPGPGIGDGPRFVTGDVVPPELVHKVQPRYPEAARLARLPGRVFLKAVIGVDGSVERVEVLSATHPMFEEEAVAAVKQWRYTPARYHGIPVAVFFTVTVNFVMR